MRALVAAALLGAALGVPAASAASSCAAVADATNDALNVASGVAGPRSDSAMDVERLSIATDLARVTMVAKVYGLTQVDTMAPTGRLFDLDFTVRGKRKHLRLVLDATGQVSADPGATYVVDLKSYEVRVTMPLSALGLADLRGQVKRSKQKPDVVTELGAATLRWQGDLRSGQAVDTEPVDAARGPVDYVHRAASSCVKVGQ
jgi:hypothetical protein